MLIGIPNETPTGERRVAATPTSVKRLAKLGYDVQVESGAGDLASFPDTAYTEAGARIVSREDVFSNSDIVMQIGIPDDATADAMRRGQALISFLWPAQNETIVSRLAEQGIHAIGMDCVPRISRAQKLDALSSMSNIGGYRAIIEAANEFGSFFTGQITAAGKVPPAQVLVIGAGVAGLAAIGTARGLGAIVRAFDTRPAVKEQVESMGAEFLELEFEEDGSGSGGYAKTMSKEFIEAEMALFAEQAKQVDIIVTTALIPGKPAPKLITEEMVRSMKPGSVIVDMAAERGGNCQCTVPHEKATVHGVKIIGYSDLPARLPTQASNLYANNLVNLLTDMTPAKDGQIVFDLDDEVIRGCLVTHENQVIWPPPKKESPAPAPTTAAEPTSTSGAQEEKRPFNPKIMAATMFGTAVLAMLLLLLLGYVAPRDFVNRFTVFVLSCFVGWQVIWNVAPSLHTPLMSVTNAISGIVIVGAILQMPSTNWLISLIAAAGVVVAMINVSGGFAVTHRMLNMFRKQD